MKLVNSVLILTLFTGIIMLMVAQYSVCPPPKVEYRYIPRNLEQQMRDSNFDKEIFKTVFSADGDVWLESIRDTKLNKNMVTF